MAVREISWIDLPFGLFVAGLIGLGSAAITVVVSMVIFGLDFYEGADAIFVVAPAAWALGILVLMRRYPGPGPIIERPWFALGALLIWPIYVGVIIALGGASFVTDWLSGLLIMLIWGFSPSLAIGFAILFAIHSEAVRGVPRHSTSWPIVRPAGSQGGMHGVLTGEAKVVAGLERAGPEEQRPDTFIRMKTKD